MANIPDGLGDMNQLLKRFKVAQNNWELWRSIHQESMDFAAPERSTFYWYSPGQRKNRHIFDSTAVLGLEKYANKMQTSLVPPWKDWMELTPGSEVEEEEAKEIKKDLEDATKTFFKNLNHSNFSTEITPSFSDHGIGTGGIMIEEGDFEKGQFFNFSNVPLAEMYPEAGLKTVWRKQKLEIRQLADNWPKADLTSTLKSKLKDAPQTEVSIINAMVHKPDDNTYHHLIIYEQEKALLLAQTFNTMRLIVFRSHVTPGEIFGRGPIMQVLADIRTLNKVKQFILENAAIQMAGIYTGIDDGIFNPHTTRIAPGSIIPVSQNGTQNPSLQALPRAGDIGLGAMVLEDLQNTIRKALYIEPLGDISDPVRTATEIMIRNQEQLKESGANISRLKTELIEPLVAAGIDILQSAGQIAPIKVDGRMISLKQTSPMAKAEDLEDFQNSQVWFDRIVQMGQLLGPEIIMGTVKIEELANYWGEKLGIPSDLIRDKAERKQLAETAINAAQQMGGPGGGQPVAA